MQYKESQDGAKKIQQNTANAHKKTKFHTLGAGGYKGAMPKWDRMEQDIIARGFVPATLDWPDRARNYFYAHRGTLNPEDGSLVISEKIRQIATRLLELIKVSAEGTFVPDREKDELSVALGNPEHKRRCRGKGVITWKLAFHEHIAS